MSPTGTATLFLCWMFTFLFIILFPEILNNSIAWVYIGIEVFASGLLVWLDNTVEKTKINEGT